MPAPVSTGLLALGGLGQGLASGVETYMKVRDQQEQKRKNDAAIAQQQATGLLQKANTAIDARKAGVDFNPDTGEVTESDYGKAQRQGLLAKAGLDAEKETATTEELKARKALTEKQTEKTQHDIDKPPKDPNATYEFRDAQLAKRLHAKVIDKIDRDPMLRQQLGQITNLRNAASLAENAVKEGKPITKQQFADLQQSVISSLGIKGQGSVGEREEKLFTSAGINGKAALQFLTGKPQDIGRNNPLYGHVKDLARWASDNASRQYSEQLENLTAGNDYIYDDNPVLKASLNKKIAQLNKVAKNRQFTDEPIAGAVAAPAAPQSGPGLLRPAPGPAVPPVGTVKNGYKFLGGNPADPKAWGKM